MLIFGTVGTDEGRPACGGHANPHRPGHLQCFQLAGRPPLPRVFGGGQAPGRHRGANPRLRAGKFDWMAFASGSGLHHRPRRQGDVLRERRSELYAEGRLKGRGIRRHRPRHIGRNESGAPAKDVTVIIRSGGPPVPRRAPGSRATVQVLAQSDETASACASQSTSRTWRCCSLARGQRTNDNDCFGNLRGNADRPQLASNRASAVPIKRIPSRHTAPSEWPSTTPPPALS